MTARHARRELARWETASRAWAFEAARSLALAMYDNRSQPVTPYQVGVVLDSEERPLIEIPARFLNEGSPATGAPATWNPPLRPWLITNHRVVGRLGDDQLYGWRWQHFIGCRVELRPGSEFVTIDAWDGFQLSWVGPAVAPLAVAAIFRLYGPAALLDHPGLAPLRRGPDSGDRTGQHDGARTTVAG
jgi:hypothetical protein